MCIRDSYKGGQEQLWHIKRFEGPRLYTEAEGWKRLRIWGTVSYTHLDVYKRQAFLTSGGGSIPVLAAKGNPSQINFRVRG